MRQIGKKFGIDHMVVSRIAKKEGITPSAPASLMRERINDATRRDALNLLTEGQLTRTEIARQLGISMASLRSIAKAGGIDPVRGIPLNAEVRLNAIQLLTQGDITHGEIARRLGISPSTVAKIATKQGIPLTAANSLRTLKLTPETRRYIVNRLKEGVTQQEIGSEAGVSQTKVSQIAIQEGISVPMPTGIKPEQIDQVFALKDQGKSTDEIADAVKVSQKKVKNIVANYNANTYKKSWWDTTPEKRTAAIQQLDEGNTPKEVARDLQLPLETVRGIANQHRVARDSLASELLAQGKSPAEIADSLDMHAEYVRRLKHGVPEGSHDIRFSPKDRDAAMDMFEKGYTREEVATKLGISPWKAHSLANEFRTKTMDSVTSAQLDDIARALGTRDYSFTTGDLARATNLPDSTVALVEQEYTGGYIARALSPKPGTSSALSPQWDDHYEWIPPLSPEQEIEAIRAMDEGDSLEDIATQLKQPYAAIERLHEQDLPLVAPQDDIVDAPPAEGPHQATVVFSEADQAEIRNLSQQSGLSASFIANWLGASEEQIKSVLSSNP